jgi:thymine-DNA glycosylase
MLLNVDSLENRIRQYKPLAVCVIGKGIWETIYSRKKFGRKVGKEFSFGWQVLRLGREDGGWEGAKCFVTPSTSGRVAGYSREFQEVLWKELGDWVREERGDNNEIKQEINGEDTITVNMEVETIKTEVKSDNEE